MSLTTDRLLLTQHDQYLSSLLQAAWRDCVALLQTTHPELTDRLVVESAQRFTATLARRPARSDDGCERPRATDP